MTTKTTTRPAVNWLLEYCDNLSPNDRCIEIMDRERAIDLIHKIQADAFNAGVLSYVKVENAGI